MIPMLYEPFKHWAAHGSVYIISDTHFDDIDCKSMYSDWITPEEHIAKIKKYVHKTDTLIHLGDVGDPSYLTEIKAHKVLIMGNHDVSVTKFKPYFDEIYTGPLFIAEKILLSHEPIAIDGVMNIHGHCHYSDKELVCGKGMGICYDYTGIDLAADVVGFIVFDLGKEIEEGLVSKIDSVHRLTIDKATRKRRK